MPEFKVEFTKTQITRHEITIEADSAEEAMELVDQYEIDFSEATEIDSFKWEISDAEIVGTEPDAEPT